MKRAIYLLFFASIIAANANAQVTIGSIKAPEAGAVLELKSDKLGFLPTRIELSKLSLPDPLPAHVEGMVVYNLTVSKSDTLQTGLYYNTGTRWMRLSTTPSFSENWFYMPSIVFDTSEPSSTERTVNLHQEFKDQLNSAIDAKEKSVGAPDLALSTVPGQENLYYYVTAYDPEVFEIVSISKAGLMTYKIKATATDETFINIVFVEK